MTPLTRALCFAVAFGLAPLIHLGPTLAQDVKLPPSITFTAYDTGSSGFNIAVAVGKMLKDSYKSDVRVLPAGNAPRAARAVEGGAGPSIGHGYWKLLRPGRHFRVRCQGLRDTSHCRSCSPRLIATTFRSASPRIPAPRRSRISRVNESALSSARPPQPEHAGYAGVRRAQRSRCESRRVRKLRRHVEGRAQRPDRRRRGFEHIRPGKRGRKLAAGRFLSGHAALGTRPLGLGSRKSVRTSRAIRQRAASRLRRRPPSRPLPIRTPSSWSTRRSPTMSFTA